MNGVLVAVVQVRAERDHTGGKHPPLGEIRQRATHHRQRRHRIEAEQDNKLADWQQWGRKASYEKHLRDDGGQ